MALLIPMWYYGIQIWGSAKQSNVRSIQAFQFIRLSLLSGAPWYNTNDSFHKDVCIPTLKILPRTPTKNHTKHTVPSHSNPIIKQLSSK